MQKWQWYLTTTEMLALAQTKGKPALTTRLAEFRKDFAEIGVGKIFEYIDLHIH